MDKAAMWTELRELMGGGKIQFPGGHGLTYRYHCDGGPLNGHFITTRGMNGRMWRGSIMDPVTGERFDAWYYLDYKHFVAMYVKEWNE